MARIRSGCCYRGLERPYTRISKYKRKGFVKVRPALTIVKFDLGDTNKKFDYQVQLVSRNDVQIRHNALESARQTSNRLLETTLGKNGYHLKVRTFPHHIIRENVTASGAGADRVSTGMQKAFGKPVSSAARIRKGQIVIHVDINKANLDLAKQALKKASYKFPFSWDIITNSTPVLKE